MVNPITKRIINIETGYIYATPQVQELSSIEPIGSEIQEALTLFQRGYFGNQDPEDVELNYQALEDKTIVYGRYEISQSLVLCIKTDILRYTTIIYFDTED